MTKLYADRKPWLLEPHYSKHVMAMTAEGLHEKSAIAAELAHRDALIAVELKMRDVRIAELAKADARIAELEASLNAVSVTFTKESQCNPGLDCKCGGKLQREVREFGAVMVCDRCGG